MPVYETEAFRPPAPVIRARVVGPAGTLSDVPLVLDSGADVSVVPLAAAVAVGAPIGPPATAIRFLAGREIVVAQAQLAIEFLRYRFRGSFLVIESSYGVVGRNVLNALAVTLDSPRLEWSIAE